jgi:hypothetical protein
VNEKRKERNRRDGVFYTSSHAGPIYQGSQTVKTGWKTDVTAWRAKSLEQLHVRDQTF